MSLEEKVRKLGVDHDRLSRVVVVEGVLVNDSPLRIGRPGEALRSPVDLALERLPDGRPYIPGSSLKGVLRSLAERIARSTGYRVCNVFAIRNPCDAGAWVARRVLEAAKKWSSIGLDDILRGAREKFKDVPETEELLNKLSGCRDLDSVVKVLEEEGVPCVVCRVFGCRELASHLYVYDCYPKEEPTVEYRTRVAIDRFRRAARSGALFTYEYVPPGYKWRFRLKFFNLEGDARQLVESLLDYIRKVGIEVGSMRSVGLGRLVLKEAITSEYVVKKFRLVKVGGG